MGRVMVAEQHTLYEEYKTVTLSFDTISNSIAALRIHSIVRSSENRYYRVETHIIIIVGELRAL